MFRLEDRTSRPLQFVNAGVQFLWMQVTQDSRSQQAFKHCDAVHETRLPMQELHFAEYPSWYAKHTAEQPAL